MCPSEQSLGTTEARQRLDDAMRQDLDFHAKITRLLEIGEAFLGVENGHVARIEPTVNYWETFQSTDSFDGRFPVGLTLDLESTYCRRTIRQESTIALHDAPNQGWEDDPAFEAHGLHCYHGTPITVGDDIYGTVCFVSQDPRTKPFSAEEEMFTDLVGQMIGRILEREFHEAELTNREQLIGVLNRILRHNLRNDLNVVRGHAEIVHDRLPENEMDHAATITDTVDDLLKLSDKARQLNTVVNQTRDRQEHVIEELVRHAVTVVRDDYPNTSLSVEEGMHTTVRVSTSLETALCELIENAAKHGGDEPVVTVSVSCTQQSLQIQVADNGPGMPEQERSVLQQGTETPLEHGSGIGLWLVYWIIMHHDGHIETTVSESGTTVTIMLPHGTGGCSNRE